MKEKNEKPRDWLNFILFKSNQNQVYGDDNKSYELKIYFVLIERNNETFYYPACLYIVFLIMLL